MVGKIYAVELNNIDAIDSMVVISITDQFESLRNENNDSIAFDVSNLDLEKRNYLKILIGNLAIEKSFKVFRNYNPTSSFQGLVLTISQFTTSIEYSKPFEKSFLGKNYVNRRIETDLRGQFYSARTNEVKKIIDKKSQYNDDIPYSLISDVEYSNYKFSKGNREDYSFWDKIYEPVLVIASVATVVYLFFTQRT
jgi:hypothetical protein